MLVYLFNQIRKKLVIFVHFKGFNISQKPKSSPLQCLKWTVAQSPNATNILFGRPKAAPN